MTNESSHKKQSKSLKLRAGKTKKTDVQPSKIVDEIVVGLINEAVVKSARNDYVKPRRESLYSLEEYDEDHHETLTKIPEGKPAKKTSFFGSVFRRKSTTKDVGEKLSRSSSLRVKLSSLMGQNGPLRRSMSFKDLKRDKLSEMKSREWASSLQSLVESDLAISYKDLSFIDYDYQNQISYGGETSSPKKSGDRRRHLQRAKSFHEKSLSGTNDTTNPPNNNLNSLDFSGAVSLPSLSHLPPENADFPRRHCGLPKRRQRHSSVCLENYFGEKVEDVTADRKCSFKSAGSGGVEGPKRRDVKRRRRPKSDTNNNNRNGEIWDLEGVRSKSLTHLDEIEMRQSTESSASEVLKDSRSEPDCAQDFPAFPVLQNRCPFESIEPVKKHVLSRSQKSSSECFSVNFEVGDRSTWETELFFPAVHGVTIQDSLGKLCELRGIDIGSCDAWLQDKETTANNAWLPFSQDTACLVGKHVRITAKDFTKKSSNSRKPSTSVSVSQLTLLPAKFDCPQSTKSTRSASFFNSSIEDGQSLEVSDPNKKQIKQRWSGFFSNTKDTRMEMLVEQLNGYAKSGIPYCEIYPEGQCESIDALYKLESDWKHIVNANDLTERAQRQQTALWELIKTEAAYIKTLKVVTDLFMACLQNLQSANLLKEIDTEKLFSNITEILDTNVLFWRNWIFPLVRDMRHYRQPACLENMLQGFLKISDTFQAYFRYCAEQARCQHYCRESHTHDELFTAYLAWCETQKECNRLRLMDILVQPMQRLTKYGLLLKAILRNTDDDVESDNLNLMIKSVDDFVNLVNFSLKQKQDNERLKGIIARIESYDAVETKDDDLEKLLKSYTQLDLNKPMIGCPLERQRHLLLEGDLKLKDNVASKMEVHCFLLTDMLLICKSSTKRGGATMRIVRQPYLIDRLEITELSKETPSLAAIYKNEFDIPVAAFILQNNDGKKMKSWKDSIIKAQHLYAQAKQISYLGEDSVESDYVHEYSIEGDYHSLQLVPKSPMASSSRASRVSSLAHSHSGSVEMNDQYSYNPSRAVSVEAENRTTSVSSDEGVAIPPDRSPIAQRMSLKRRIFHKTPNTLSVQPYASLGQSLPNLALGLANLNPQNTLSVPNAKSGGHLLLSPTNRGISYPPPSPTRGNLRRGLAISQSKNPPLLKTRHITSTAPGCCSTAEEAPTSFDFDVPVIAATSAGEDSREFFSRDQHRQAMLKRTRNENKRYHTAGVLDDIKHNDNKDPSIQKRLSWNSAPASSEKDDSPHQT